MSCKPGKGSGIVFQDAFNREMKYRGMLCEYSERLVGFMQYSKAYYHWLVAEKDLQKITLPYRCKSVKELYGELIPKTTLRNFESHKDLCYKPLQKLMP